MLDNSSSGLHDSASYSSEYGKSRNKTSKIGGKIRSCGGQLKPIKWQRMSSRSGGKRRNKTRKHFRK